MKVAIFPMISDPRRTSESEWRSRLTPQQYHVLREKGTEAPFTGAYHASKDKGVYRCAACGAELFSSDAKFDSGTGWPSFTLPMENVETAHDGSGGMERTEVICPHCGGHLGHVFDDGPTRMPDGTPASGKRFCINSCALSLDADDKDKKT